MAWKCSRRFDGCFLLARGPGAVQVVVGRLGAARKKRWCAYKALGRARGKSISSSSGWWMVDTTATVKGVHYYTTLRYTLSMTDTDGGATAGGQLHHRQWHSPIPARHRGGRQGCAPPRPSFDMGY